MSETKHTIDEIIDIATGWLIESWAGPNTNLMAEWNPIVPLLKAAPDLLEACRAVLNLGFHGHFDTLDYSEKYIEPVVAQLHAAIAKAEGSEA